MTVKVSHHEFKRQLRERLEGPFDQYGKWLAEYGKRVGRRAKRCPLSLNILNAFASWEQQPTPQRATELESAVDDFCRTYRDVTLPKDMK